MHLTDNKSRTLPMARMRMLAKFGTQFPAVSLLISVTTGISSMDQKIDIVHAW